MKETERIMSKGCFPADFLKEEIRCEYKVTQDLKKIWMVGLDILFELDKVCKKHNLKYFLLWGSLLGAIRHKGFIPWDDDFDFFLFEDTYQKAMEVLEKELPEDMFLKIQKVSQNIFMTGLM